MRKATEQSVEIKYPLADGKIAMVEASPEVAAFLEAEQRKERTKKRDDRRFLAKEGYIDGETELLLYDLGILGESVQDEVQRRERNRIMNEAIGRLPMKQKCYIHAYYFKGYTVEDISIISGTSERNVREILERARNRMQRLLESSPHFHEWFQQ